MEIRRTDCHRACACQNKFDRIVRIHDTAHADDRKLDRLRHLVNHANCHWFHCRAGQTASTVGYRKGSPVDIDLHASQCVDQGQHIRTACLGCLRHLRDVGNIRTELHDNRLFRMAFYLAGDRLHCFRILSKCDAALLDVRAGNVDLQHIDRLARQFFHYIDVIFRRFSTYIDDNLRIILT